jgi:DNA-binding winged helix-turn-helix (wHTH) protein
MAKKSKPKKAATNATNEEHKLSPLEIKLLGYCKNHQPVLLFGEDKIRRRDLILNVHKANGGLDQNQEYYKDPQDKELEFGKSTERTWDHVNLPHFGSSEIYHYLTTIRASDKSEYSPHDFDEKKTPYKEGFFYCCKGLLFLDNLLCSDENKQLSYKLELHIKDQNTSFQWLVIYAEKLEGLSTKFRDQFELISLEGEKTVTVSVDEVESDIIHCDDKYVVNRAVIIIENNCLKRNGINNEVSLFPKQIELLKFLYDSKNELVQRGTIMNQLWHDAIVGDDQITDHVSALVSAFVELDFSKEMVKTEIIETVKKSKEGEGGYIFHNKLVFLDYD